MVSLFRPGAGIDLWLALLVTGVVTVVLWAVARPFRRLVSMVSLTREQFGGIVPGAGTGPMSRVWQRMRGGPSATTGRPAGGTSGAGRGGGHGDPDGARPEAEPGHARCRPGPDAASPPRRRPPVDAGAAPALVPAARRPALPAGAGRIGGGTGGLPAGPSPARSTTG